MASGTVARKMDPSPATKSEQTKKFEVVKELQQLKIKIQNFEREKVTHLYNKRSEFSKDFTPLQEMEVKMNQQLKAERQKVTQQLNKIKNMVKKFHRELQDVKPTPEFVEKLKVIMEDIESHITTFKDSQRQQYEELMAEERITNQEITVLERKFESWSQQGAAQVPATTGRTTALASQRDVTKDLPPEVAEFERFMQLNGGPRGGWDDYDHGTFLKFRNKHKGKLTFLQELVSFLPTKTEQEIRDHEAWFQQYLQLNDQKKEAIQRWREKKEIEKETVVSKAVAAEEEGSEDEEEKKKHELRQQIFDQEREVRKAQLNKWKVEKQLEKAETEERKLRREMEDARKIEKERLRQQERKKQVDEYRKQKEEKDHQKQLERAMLERIEREERRKNKGVEIISKFRERDLAAAYKKRDKDQSKQEAERQKAEKLERMKYQVEANVERNPSRLLQPTAGWMERQKQSSENSGGGGQVLQMPHRAVPSWRQGVS